MHKTASAQLGDVLNSSVSTLPCPQNVTPWQSSFHWPTGFHVSCFNSELLMHSNMDLLCKESV